MSLFAARCAPAAAAAAAAAAQPQPQPRSGALARLQPPLAVRLRAALTLDSAPLPALASARRGTAPPRCPARPAAALPRAAAAAAPAPPPRPRLPTAALVAAVVALGVANRVLYKIALVPLAEHTAALALASTCSYIAFYFSALAARRRAGKVTDAMLDVPRKEARAFAAVGGVEAASALLTLAAAARLPGVALPLLSQTVLFWQILLARLVFRRRLGAAQLAGAAAVAAGVALAGVPAAGGASPLAGAHPGAAALFVFAMLFPALATVLKEHVFRAARLRHLPRGQELDLFVVNSFGSAAQAVAVLAALPLLAAARGFALADAPARLAAGAACLCGGGAAACAAAPAATAIYIVVNLAFNVSALALIRRAGNVAISLTMSAVVPLSVAAFALPLPLGVGGAALGPAFLAGVALLTVGLCVYNSPAWWPPARAWLAAGRARVGGAAP